MATANDILTIAKAEIGNMDNGNNKVKYNTEYYGSAVSGSAYPWCVVFVWWCFKQAGASSLFYGGGKTASCTTLKNYHKNLGQAVTDGNYQPGDFIFFNFSGGTTTAHIGICESWDGMTITTIDGNTSSSNEANGGTVNRRARNKKYIVAAIRPKYATETVIETETEEEEMTQEQFNSMMDTYLAGKATLAASDWAKENVEEAITLGISDGTNPQSFTTRQEVMTMLTRLIDIYQSK